MKQLQILILAVSVSALLASGCDKNDDTPKVDPSYTITFETSEYQDAMCGPTFYGENCYSTYETNPSDAEYAFYQGVTDKTTGLKFTVNTKDFWGGGCYISHYNNTVKGDYTNQLSVYSGENEDGLGGHNASTSFCVLYGYNSSYSQGGAIIKFEDADSLATFESMWVNNTTYTYMTAHDGNQFSKAFSYDDKSWFLLRIYGLDSAGTKTDSVDFYLADYRTDDAVGTISDWTEVDLTSLGKVNGLSFDFKGSDTGDYGLNTPTYVAIDDIKLIKD